ncbi:MAG: hypothetical protein VX550_11065 [Bacteroidota bacterium]|nr:hypothetical protein [Bacteroidota bacterium]
MKLYLSSLIFTVWFAFSQAQIDPNSIMGIPTLTTTEINSISNPNEGSIVYNTTDQSLYLRNATSWKKLTVDESKTVILNRNGGSLPTAINTFYDLPLTNSHVTTINNDYYTISGTSEITILQQGNYLISGELSTTNMPAGDNKYILAVFINGSRRGYLSRGFASIPSRDFWGTTGTIMFSLNANDVINIRYVLNVNGATLNANFSNIGITKI